MIGAMPCWSKSPAWLPIYDQASFNPTDTYPGSHEGSLLRENLDTLEITGIAVSDVNVVILLVDPRSTTQSQERKKTL